MGVNRTVVFWGSVLESRYLFREIAIWGTGTLTAIAVYCKSSVGRTFEHSKYFLYSLLIVNI